MDRLDNMNPWFEHIIRSNESEAEVHYAAIESALTRRIHECEERGILGLLCIEEIPENEQFERVERDLFTQITQYCEYDEPVNECLRSDMDLHEKQWERITRKIDEHLWPVMSLPLWEQQILAPEGDLTDGDWEKIESLLFERINRADSRIQEYWEPYEISEEPVMSVSMEIAEELLDRHIRSVASRQPWEHILAADTILPMSKWERIEHTFFSSINADQHISLNKQPFWYIIEHYASVFKGIAVAGAAVAMLVTTGFGIKAYRENIASLPTVVYQVNGNAAGHIDMAQKINEQCSTEQGGGVTLVNSHGSIELCNYSALKIEKLSTREAKYRVRFSSENAAVEGNVSFFVRKTDKRHNFSVATQHYNIEVKGTYFRIESDVHGTVATNVLEGMVKITNSPLGDTLLQAGQTLKYDPNLQRYRIISGGSIVSRDELERMPDIDALLRYAVITFNSTVLGSDVYLNGKWYGKSPLKLRLPPGEYQTVISKQNYISLDTLLSIADTPQEYRFNFSLRPNEPLVRTAKRSDYIATSGDGTVKHSDTLPSTISEKVVVHESESDIAKLYARAQQAERNDNWRKAIKLYQEVFNNPNTTPLRREDVLFSIGKLQADHITDIEIAKQTFLTYLALFPTGSFAGESWLRLAELEFQKNQENAIHYYLKFFDQFPRHPRIAELRDRVGVIYLQQKRYAKAIAMFEQALISQGLSEEDATNIASHLHRALFDCGQKAKAETVRTKYLLSVK